MEGLLELDRDSSGYDEIHSNPNSISPISRRPPEHAKEPEREVITIRRPLLKMNPALVAVLRQNPGMAERLRDEIVEDPYWEIKFKEEVAQDADEF